MIHWVTLYKLEMVEGTGVLEKVHRILLKTPRRVYQSLSKFLFSLLIIKFCILVLWYYFNGVFRGQIIARRLRVVVFHTAIYVGDEKVVHMSKEGGNDNRIRVREGDFKEQFLKGQNKFFVVVSWFFSSKCCVELTGSIIIFF